MKKFFKEFGDFIKRGNVLDLAVGVIIGGAFTGIVNGLSNYILKPIINWLLALVLKTDGLEGAVTILSSAFNSDGTLDLANSIYIDWGAFISAIINFFLIAMVLFLIVKTINRVSTENTELMKKIKKNFISKEDRKELKKLGIKLKDEEKVKEYFAEKQKKLDEEKRLAELKALEEKKNNPSVEDLLKDIRALLEKKEIKDE